MVTIKDIAKRAGVSRSTVSRALQDHPRIGQDTKDKVRRIADELGYVPNYIAQSLSARRTLTIGVVITGVNNPFTWKVVEGVDVTAHAHGNSVLFSTSRNDHHHEMEVIDSFRRRRVDGIIIISTHMASLYSAHLSGIDIPVVLINNQQEGEKLRSVAIDDYAGACLAMRHLIGLGHARIVYLGPVDRVRSSQKRYAAYRDMLREAGHPAELALQTMLDQPTDFETGQDLAEQVIAHQATAAFCYNDRVALGLMAALREQRFRVPDRLSIVGFDDIDEAQHAVPRLTTVRQPQYQLGQYAVEMLFQLMETDESQVMNRILPCELIVRETTRAPESASS